MPYILIVLILFVVAVVLYFFIKAHRPKPEPESGTMYLMKKLNAIRADDYEERFSLGLQLFAAAHRRQEETTSRIALVVVGNAMPPEYGEVRLEYDGSPLQTVSSTNPNKQTDLKLLVDIADM